MSLEDKSESHVQGNHVGDTGRKRHRRWLVWALPAMILILILSFPLWNPQKLYIRYLINELGDQSTHDKALKMLTQDFGQRAVTLLIENLDNKDPRIQAGAEDALVAIGAPAIAPLLEEVNLPGRSETLIKIGAPAVQPIFVRMREINNGEVWNALICQIGMPAVEPLITIAGDGGQIDRSNIIHILFSANCWGLESGILVKQPPTGDTRSHVITLLSDLMKDDHPAVRKELVSALPNLMWVADERIALLITALNDEDLSVRTEALASINLVEDDRAVPALLEALNSSDPDFRAKIAGALSSTKTGINALIGRFTAEELTHIYNDYKSIIKAGDVASVPVLIAAMFSHEDQDLVEVFLNCGNADLYTAAQHWAWNRGYYVLPSTAGSPGTTWGAP